MQKLIKNLNYLWKNFKKDNKKFWDELEEHLILSDVSVNTAEKILSNVKEYSFRENIKDVKVIKNLLKKQIVNILSSNGKREINISKITPTVIMFVGVNGVGKTTTIAKIANLFQKMGNKILISAADTYRSAAVEQIDYFAKNLGLDIVYHQRNSDPGAVVYDSLEKALAKKIDIVLIDTAGRMQTSYNLMEELKKIRKVIFKKLNRDVDEILMVLDSTTGQNAKFQIKVFHEALKITGIILTKVDSSSKGGIILTIKNDLNIPIKFLTNGEKIDNICCFDPEEFTEMIFS